jgi:TPR repeat protein
MFPSVAYAVIMLELMKYHGSGCRKDDDAALAQFDRAWQMGHPLGLKYAVLTRMSKREYIRAVPDFIRSALMIVWYYGIRRYPLIKAPRETASIFL